LLIGLGHLRAADVCRFVGSGLPEVCGFGQRGFRVLAGLAGAVDARLPGVAQRIAELFSVGDLFGGALRVVLQDVGGDFARSDAAELFPLDQLARERGGDLLALGGGGFV
jgi:hypothetical protein